MRISRQTILNTLNTHVYLYGDDAVGKAQKGQASVCAGISNCFPVPTKFRHCCEDNSFFSDLTFELLARPLIDRAFENIIKGQKGRKLVIFPKIGQGCAELPTRSPLAYAYIQTHIKTLLELQ